MSHLVLLSVACVLVLSSWAMPAPMFPFVLPWNDASGGVTNVSDWLEKPAGKNGFVQVRGEHLFAGEKRLRLMGVNLAFGANFPTHTDADGIAARLARFGINCVRFHHMDNQRAPAGIWAADMKTLDPGQLDRLDYLIAALKKQGIYSDLNLHVSREYPDMPRGPGVSGYFKGLDLFYPPMIDMQKDYARQLLGHVNAYTKNAYSHEPAVAIVEINNEDGLICEWWNGALDNMPEAYRTELTTRWNHWLSEKYADQKALTGSWQTGSKAPGEEMLKNGDFGNVQSSWFLEQHADAKAEATIEQNDTGHSAMKINVTHPGTENWHVQLSQVGLTFQKGQAYRISFRAKASEKRAISIAICQSTEPWRALGTAETTLETQWKDFTLSIPSAADESKGRLVIGSMGSAVGMVWLSQIKLSEAGLTGLDAGEVWGSVPFFRRNASMQRTPNAQRDWMTFLWKTEEAYWVGMSAFLKNELGVKAPIVGSATAFSPPTIQSKLDIVDVHAYWQHPSFPKRDWSNVDWSVNNVPMSGVPGGGVIPGMAQRRVVGKPFICTEFNASAPNTYSSEAFLLLGAYAAMQDWDGLFAFAYSHRTNDWDEQKMTGFFDIDQHPNKMVTLPAVAALFERGDVAIGSNPLVADVSADGSIKQSMVSGPWWMAQDLGQPKLAALVQRVAIRETESPAKPAALPIDPNKPLISQGGELTWDVAQKRVIVDTPLSKALIGKTDGKPVRLGDVTIKTLPNMQDWAAISITLMSGKSFSSAGSILITATGNLENTGMQWKTATRTSVGRNWGKAPSLVEGIPAIVTLPTGDRIVKAWALNDRGARWKELPVVSTNGATTIEIGPAYQTLWYEVEIK